MRPAPAGPGTLELPFDHPIAVEFRQFHADNPHVYRLFCRFALEAVATGRRHYSAKAVVERIRWHVDVDVNRDSSGFLINNNYPAFYARLFERDHPELRGFLRCRKSLADTHRLPQ